MPTTIVATTNKNTNWDFLLTIFPHDLRLVVLITDWLGCVARQSCANIKKDILRFYKAIILGNFAPVILSNLRMVLLVMFLLRGTPIDCKCLYTFYIVIILGCSIALSIASTHCMYEYMYESNWINKISMLSYLESNRIWPTYKLIYGQIYDVKQIPPHDHNVTVFCQKCTVNYFRVTVKIIL